MYIYYINCENTLENRKGGAKERSIHTHKSFRPNQYKKHRVLCVYMYVCVSAWVGDGMNIYVCDCVSVYHRIGSCSNNNNNTAHTLHSSRNIMAKAVV